CQQHSGWPQRTF
nr:immunoglobulin light chain junction region [Macaca mulatta]